MRFRVLWLMVFLASLATSAGAELTYNEMMHRNDKSPGGTSQLLDNYLTGVYEGINAANLAYYMQTRNQLFCKPGSLDLNLGDLRKLIKDSHDTFDPNNDIPVSYLMFIGLKQTFPCL